MKLLPRIIFGVVVALSIAAILNAEERSKTTIKYPSDLMHAGKRGSSSHTLAFVLQPFADLRALYCDDETLRNRISNHVCVVDFNNPDRIPLEINVSGGSTLGEVLRSFDYRKLPQWQELQQPAINIVKQSMICGPDGSRDYLKTPIVAGDFVIITSTY